MHASVLIFLLVLASIAAQCIPISCGWHREKAERNAYEWAKELGFGHSIVICNDATNANGFVPCTFRDHSGALLSYECTGGTVFFQSSAPVASQDSPLTQNCTNASTFGTFPDSYRLVVRGYPTLADTRAWGSDHPY